MNTTMLYISVTVYIEHAVYLHAIGRWEQLLPVYTYI